MIDWISYSFVAIYYLFLLGWNIKVLRKEFQKDDN